MITERKVHEVLPACLLGWPLYKSADQISTHQSKSGVSWSKNGTLWIGFNAHKHDSKTRFDLNIIDGSCIIVFLKIAKKHRGKGVGNELYERLVDFAGKVGCSEIKQNPSGWTPSGETRRDYLIRRGWQEVSRREVAIAFHPGSVTREA